MLPGKLVGLAAIVLLLGVLAMFPDFFGVPRVLNFFNIPNFFSKVPNCGDEQAVIAAQRLVVDTVAKRLPAAMIANDARRSLRPKITMISTTRQDSNTGLKNCSAQLTLVLSPEETRLATNVLEKNTHTSNAQLIAIDLDERRYLVTIEALRQVWDKEAGAITHSLEYTLSKSEGKGESGFLVGMSGQQLLNTTMAVEFVFLLERAQRSKSTPDRPSERRGTQTENDSAIPRISTEESKEHQFLPRPDPIK